MVVEIVINFKSTTKQITESFRLFLLASFLLSIKAADTVEARLLGQIPCSDKNCKLYDCELDLCNTCKTSYHYELGVGRCCHDHISIKYCGHYNCDTGICDSCQNTGQPPYCCSLHLALPYCAAYDCLTGVCTKCVYFGFPPRC